MSRFAERSAPLLAALLGGLLLSACATGQGSFVAGSGGGGSDSFFADESSSDDSSFDTAAPTLLAAGGNVLLPGSRAPIASTAGANLLGVNAATGLTAPLTTVNVTAQLSGPLLGLSGPRTALLGLSANPALLGSSLNISTNLGGTITPNTAATQLLINVNAVATTPVTGPIGLPTSPTLPPLTPPTLTSGVPGSTPLSTLLALLPKPGGQGGLLGN